MKYRTPRRTRWMAALALSLAATSAQAVDLLVITQDNRIGLVQPPDYTVIRGSSPLQPLAGHVIHDVKADPRFFDRANVVTRSGDLCFLYAVSLRDTGTQALNSGFGAATQSLPCPDNPHLEALIFQQAGGRIAGGNQINQRSGSLDTLQNLSGSGAVDIVGFTRHETPQNVDQGGELLALDRASNSLGRIVNLENGQFGFEVIAPVSVTLTSNSSLSGGTFSDGQRNRFGPLVMMTGGRAYQLNEQTGAATDLGALPANLRAMAIDIHAPQRREFGARAFDGGQEGGGGGGGSLGLAALLSLFSMVLLCAFPRLRPSVGHPHSPKGV